MAKLEFKDYRDACMNSLSRIDEDTRLARSMIYKLVFSVAKDWRSCYFEAISQLNFIRANLRNEDLLGIKNPSFSTALGMIGILDDMRQIAQENMSKPGKSKYLVAKGFHNGVRTMWHWGLD